MIHNSLQPLAPEGSTRLLFQPSVNWIAKSSFGPVSLFPPAALPPVHEYCRVGLILSSDWPSGSPVCRMLIGCSEIALHCCCRHGAGCAISVAVCFHHPRRKRYRHRRFRCERHTLRTRPFDPQGLLPRPPCFLASRFPSLFPTLVFMVPSHHSVRTVG